MGGDVAADQAVLVAMAGERMQAGPWREISGVCTDPGHQGRGLARDEMEMRSDLRRQGIAASRVRKESTLFKSDGKVTAASMALPSGKSVSLPMGSGIAYSLSGTDAGSFTIDASTGEVKLTGNPNYEAKSSYSFTVVGTDAAGNPTEKAVTLNVGNVDETGPTITSASAGAVDATTSLTPAETQRPTATPTAPSPTSRSPPMPRSSSRSRSCWIPACARRWPAMAGTSCSAASRSAVARRTASPAWGSGARSSTSS